MQCNSFKMEEDKKIIKKINFPWVYWQNFNSKKLTKFEKYWKFNLSDLLDNNEPISEENFDQFTFVNFEVFLSEISFRTDKNF